MLFLFAYRHLFHLQVAEIIGINPNLGFHCQLIVLVFGSHGYLHKLVLHGQQLGGLRQPNAKWLANFCSISAII